MIREGYWRPFFARRSGKDKLGESYRALLSRSPVPIYGVANFTPMPTGDLLGVVRRHQERRNSELLDQIISSHQRCSKRYPRGNRRSSWGSAPLPRAPSHTVPQDAHLVPSTGSQTFSLSQRESVRGSCAVIESAVTQGFLSSPPHPIEGAENVPPVTTGEQPEVA